MHRFLVRYSHLTHVAGMSKFASSLPKICCFRPASSGFRNGSTRTSKARASLFFISVLLGCDGSSGFTLFPDRVLYNARVVTLDTQSTIAEAVAIRDGRVMAVGETDKIRSLAGPGTDQIEMGGRTVIPGLADNHFHSIGGGPGVDLSRARSLADVHDAIALRVAETGPEEIIVTNSDWHEGQLAEQRLPYREDLDEAAPDNPVVVVRGGHEYVLNTAALKYWNITDSTPEPPGGLIGRDETGRLNGELVDRAKGLIRLPRSVRLGYEEQIQLLAEEHRLLNQVGLTSIRYAGGSPDQYRMLLDMKQRGILTIRASVLFRLEGSIDPARLDETFSEWGIHPDEGDEWVRVAGIKLGIDGGFEGGWMREPYQAPWDGEEGFRGLQTVPTERYVSLVRALNGRGWRVATHAVGDAAIDLVLEAYEAAHGDSPIVGKRWVIEHAFVSQSDQLPRMKALGLQLSVQDHLYVAAPSLRKYWGAERADGVTPIRTYLDSGLDVSLGTDSPVVPYPAMWALYHFITRNTISAGVAGADQRIGREEALRLSSLGNANLTFEEDNKGSLEVGKWADLIVLSEDILSVPGDRIENIEVLMTMVSGEIVHRGSPFE